MTGMKLLFEQIAAEEDDLRESSQLRMRVRASLLKLELPEQRVRPFGVRRGAAFAAALAVAASIAFLAWPKQKSPQLSAQFGNSAQPASVGAWFSAPATESVPLDFSDGTRIDLTAGSRARLVALEPTSVTLAIESGRARVHVVHRPHATWQLSTGPFTVHVTGTRFTVGWNPEQDTFELELTEGSVELSGCIFGQAQRVSAGQIVRASCKRGEVSITRRGDNELGLAPTAAPLSGATVGATAVASGSGPEPAAPAASSPAPGVVALSDLPLEPPANSAKAGAAIGGTAGTDPERRAEIGPSWQSLARSGKYREAFVTANRNGFESECSNASASELVLLGDAARYAGDSRKSEYALKRLRQLFPGTKRAAEGAFALGRLSFDTLGSYAQAAQWFRTYLREQPTGSLTREARGRLLEALQRSGDEQAATAAAELYLRDYPDGPYARLARRIANPDRTP
jgi:transmembrane sensor